MKNQEEALSIVLPQKICHPFSSFIGGSVGELQFPTTETHTVMSVERTLVCSSPISLLQLSVLGTIRGFVWLGKSPRTMVRTTRLS